MLANKEFTTEKDKRSDEYLMGMTDQAINELVYPKYALQKAYNYYHGTRDAEQFRHLEENYGLGNPSSVEFTPLIKKHIDALIGEYLDTPLLPKVSCKDKDTLSNINREKQLKIYKTVFDYLSRHLNNSIIEILTGQKGNDIVVQKELEALISDLENNFISDYEIAAQNVLDYIIQSRSVDLQNKLKNMLLDLLIAGMAFYRVRPSLSSENVEIEVLNPLTTFIDYNPDSNFLKDSYRSVVVKYLTKSQILNKYGKDLDQEGLEKLQDDIDSYINSNYQYYIRNNSNTPTGYPSGMPGLVSYKDVSPARPSEAYPFYQNKLIPVHEVEWLVTNKTGKEYKMDRYETVRIANNIYILTGLSEHVIRSKDNPTQCGLSVNGIFFQDRNTEPFSLMLTCAHLQDQYDILYFFRNNLVANSGTAGDFLDMSQLPTFLGTDATERVQKWIAYKKTGVALIDSSQEGRAFNNNTVYAGYDDTLKYQAMQALDMCIERTEMTASSITGVFRERLNGIQQKDAVTNVAVGIKNSFTVTKQYYQQMDIITNSLLIDTLDISKIVYKKGLTGVLILGDKSQKIFTALPKHFTVTDYDVHIPPSTDILKQIEEIKIWALELIKAGQMPPEVIMEVITSRSLTELKTNVNKAMKASKQENGMLQQLQQQNQQLQQQLQEAGQQLQQTMQKLESLNERKLAMEENKIMMEDKRKWFELKSKDKYDTTMAALKDKQIDAEVLQIYDNNPNNNKVKDHV